MSKLLAQIPDSDLDRRTISVVETEGDATIAVLSHLMEVERREMYVPLGYSSMFAYMTNRLKYSEPAAHRRITAARCIRDFPEVGNLLQRREVSLTTIAMFSKLLTKENAEKLLSEVRGKSKTEVEAVIARYAPKKLVREKVLPVYLLSLEKAESREEQPIIRASGDPSAAHEAPSSGDILSLELSPEKVRDQATLEPKGELSYKVHCVLSKSGYERLREVQARLSHSVDSIGATVERLCDFFLNRKVRECVAKPKAELSRYIPAAVKREVLKRDGGCCTFVGSDGRRCCERRRLEIDRIYPFGLGGKTTLDNLRLVCRRHNRHLAEVTYGPNKIASKIQSEQVSAEKT